MDVWSSSVVFKDCCERNPGRPWKFQLASGAKSPNPLDSWRSATSTAMEKTPEEDWLGSCSPRRRESRFCGSKLPPDLQKMSHFVKTVKLCVWNSMLSYVWHRTTDLYWSPIQMHRPGFVACKAKLRGLEMQPNNIQQLATASNDMIWIMYIPICIAHEHL